MASNWTVCGLCNYRNINKASVVWCSECDEGLCGECREHHGASKSTRNHDTMSITEYQKLQPNVLEITQTCQKHKEHYQIFCKKHDCPCCRRCVIETHNDCNDLTAIEDIVKNVKSSNAWLEVEQTLVQMLKNVQRIRNDRTENLKCLQDQRVEIERDINQTRKMINDHLDKIHDKTIKELYANEENESKRIKLLLCEIEDIEKGISDLQGNQNNIRQHASELQTFLALKHIEKEVSDKAECIQSVLKNEDMKIKTLALEVNKDVQNIDRADCFGSVSVESKSFKVVIDSYKNKQAQMMVPIVISKCIDDIVLSNKMEINLKSSGNVRGCAILPNGQMLFSDNEGIKTIALKDNCSHDLDIALNTAAFDMAYIEGEHTIAVTTGYSGKSIHIINVNRTRKRSIKTSANPYGIALKKNTLVYCKEGKGIMEVQLNGESEKTLVCLDMPSFSYVAVYGDNMYYTNKDNHSVTCYDILGNLKWTFKNTKNLRYPQGIAVDNNGNVYVASMDTNSVVIITLDGKRCKTILSSRDGLSKPRAMHFEPTSNKFLVANETKFAFLFDVS
ncbi:tripartite motif-containing protein 2-like [Mytilus edulis]|uniref:tripartite motif-containing protein 2-like n=1 Tax=Mytilus edulis TaxID=6550 RepID=UPI0039EFDA36